MTTEYITPASEDHWLALRDGVITSTGISALFGLSPYVTRFELYHQHASGIRVPFVSNDRVEAGSRMEAYAAEEVGRKEGWQVKPFKDFAVDRELRIGSSFDYMADTPDGEAILEIKAVDFFRYRDLWVDGQAPDHIELQLQWQMLLSGTHVGYIAAWTSVYEYHLIRREYDHNMCMAMLSAVRKFWTDVDAKNEPAPDFARDEAVIAAMFRSLRPEPVSLDAAINAKIAAFELAKMQAKEFDDKSKALKAELHYILGDVSDGYTDQYRIKAGWTKDSVGKEVTADTAGTMIGAKKGYRRLDIKALSVGDDK